jgi:hypothetical protein
MRRRRPEIAVQKVINHSMGTCASKRRCLGEMMLQEGDDVFMKLIHLPSGCLVLLCCTE